jgi:hypothetical protein
MMTEMNEQEDRSVGINATVTVIDDRKPVPAGTYVGAVRLIAILGSGVHFGADGSGDHPRSAWQWVVRLPDGTLGTITHLVTLNDAVGSGVRGLAAALANDDSLLGEDVRCNADRIIGRSAMIEVRRQPAGNGRDRPYVNRAWALPLGVEPIRLADACEWKPNSTIQLPRYVPQWVRTYAEGAVAQYWQRRKGGERIG